MDHVGNFVILGTRAGAVPPGEHGDHVSGSAASAGSGTQPPLRVSSSQSRACYQPQRRSPARPSRGRTRAHRRDASVVHEALSLPPAIPAPEPPFRPAAHLSTTGSAAPTASSPALRASMPGGVPSARQDAERAAGGTRCWPQRSDRAQMRRSGQVFCLAANGRQ